MPDDVDDALRQIARQNNNFEAERFGEEGQRLYNEIKAARELTAQAMVDFTEKQKAAAAEGSTPEELAAFSEASNRLSMIGGQLATLTHAWGHAGSAFRMREGLPSIGEVRSMQELSQRTQGLTPEQLRQEAQLGQRLGTDRQRMRYNAQVRRSIYEKGRAMYIEYFVNNLISGPITHFAYSVGNESYELFKAVPETTSAATVSALRGRAAGERVYFGEVVAQLWGNMKGALDGWDAAARAWKSGVSELLPGETAADLFGPRGREPNEGAIPGGLGKAARLPSDGVAAIHSFGRAIGYTQELWRQAYRSAADAGLSPIMDHQRFGAHMADFVANPPEAAMKQAAAEATRRVMMNRAKYGSSFYRFKQAIEGNVVAKTAMPFMQIGANILHEGFMEHTPLGVFDSTIRDNLTGKNGKIAQDIQTGKILAGSALTSAVIYAAYQGRISGAGPTDPNERRLLTMQGWQPYAIPHNGKWTPFRKFLGPIGILMGAAANMGEGAKAGIKEGDWSWKTGAAGIIIGGLGEVIADESWFRGASNIIGAIRNWDTPEAERYVEDLITDFIPYSVGQSQVARFVDPYAREAHTLTERALQKIPFASRTLLPRRDLFGQPIPSKVAISSTAVNVDPTMEAMAHVGFYPAAVPRTIRGVRLTDEQYDEFAKSAGVLSKGFVDAVVNLPNFPEMPGHLQKQRLEAAFKHGRDKARDAMMVQSRGTPHDIIAMAKADKRADREYRDE